MLDLEQSGEVWVTARPGCEFEVPGGKAHVGGASHGALHALDSLSPVIIAGGRIRRRLPPALRWVDIAPLCMELLGLPMRYRPGMPRGCFFTLTRGVLELPRPSLADSINRAARSGARWQLAAPAITGGPGDQEKKKIGFPPASPGPPV